jgi:hypothetical protein
MLQKYSTFFAFSFQGYIESGLKNSAAKGQRNILIRRASLLAFSSPSLWLLTSPEMRGKRKKGKNKGEKVK